MTRMRTDGNLVAVNSKITGHRYHTEIIKDIHQHFSGWHVEHEQWDVFERKNEAIWKVRTRTAGRKGKVVDCHQSIAWKPYRFQENAFCHRKQLWFLQERCGMVMTFCCGMSIRHHGSAFCCQLMYLTSPARLNLVTVITTLPEWVLTGLNPLLTHYNLHVALITY